jgi:cell fate regulator YaaT (PSP1 superfamily)
VLTSAARIQELPPNAQRLTGQCGKLKCCLMYELETYLDAQSDFPDVLLELETDKGIAYPKKKDILQKVVYYGYSKEDTNHLIPVSIERLKEIIMLNKKGINPELIPGETKIEKNQFVSFEKTLKELSDFTTQKKQKKIKKNFKQ